jgi:hypothetical protein
MDREKSFSSPEPKEEHKQAVQSDEPSSVDISALSQLGTVREGTENWRGRFHAVTIFDNVTLSFTEDRALYVETPHDTVVIDHIQDIRKTKQGICFLSDTPERKMITTISPQGILFEYRPSSAQPASKSEKEKLTAEPQQNHLALPDATTESERVTLVELDGCIVGTAPTFKKKGQGYEWHTTIYHHPQNEHPEQSETYETHAWKLAQSVNKKKLQKGDKVWIKGYVREQNTLLNDGETKIIKHLNVLGVRVVSRASNKEKAGEEQ